MLVCIGITIFASNGTKRVGIRSRCAFNACNRPWFGCVVTRFTTCLIGGFTFTKMAGITFANLFVPIIGTGRDSIAPRGSFCFIVVTIWAFATRGVARCILKESFQTVFARCVAPTSCFSNWAFNLSCPA